MSNGLEAISFSRVTMRVHTQVLAPGAYFDLYESHNWLTLESGQNVVLNFNGMPPDVNILPGLGYRIQNWQSVSFIRVKNNDVAAQTVSVYYGLGDIIDNRVSGTVTIITPPAGPFLRLAKPATSTTGQASVGFAATVQIGVANVDRYSFSINAGDSDLFIGGAGVTAATGFRVIEGATYVLESTDDVYCIRGGADTDDVTFREEIY